MNYCFSATAIDNNTVAFGFWVLFLAYISWNVPCLDLFFFFFNAMTLTVSDSSLVTDMATHAPYWKTSTVNLLPIRRCLQSSGKLRESVIHLNSLLVSGNDALLRVRHVAVDYTRDFALVDQGVVPGSRIVAKLALLPLKLRDSELSASDKLFVFPVSACWIQCPDDPCKNCLHLLHLDFDAYETHRRFPCLRELVYGRTIDGGLQDYIRVAAPELSLVKVPSLVSLHDCCFLTDISLPFYSFCKDHLLGMLAREPHARVLVILNDAAKEANDCLLVINHLDLEHLFVTFVDMERLRKNPALVLNDYANEFHHVLVFAPGADAINAALAMSVKTKLESTKLRYSIALFGTNADAKVMAPEDKTIYRVKLSYKDKFLMEELIQTLSTFSNTSTKSKKPLRSMSMGTLSSEDLYTNTAADEDLKKKLRFKKEAEVVTPRLPRTHISWLYCDDDYKLCTEEESECSLSRCHATTDINRLIRQKCRTRRVFYTNRPACHKKMNAFIFASDQ